MTELEQKATEAWSMMIREVEPMPPFAALDFVQDAGCERDDAHDAILMAMAVWLSNLRPEGRETSSQRPAWHYRAGAVVGLLKVGRRDMAEQQLRELRVQTEAVRANQVTSGTELATFAVATAWSGWCEIAELAIDLCRAVAAEATAQESNNASS